MPAFYLLAYWVRHFVEPWVVFVREFANHFRVLSSELSGFA